MSIFDTPRKNHTKGCPVCGETNTMFVAVQARQLEGSRPTGRAITKTVNLCSTHGEAMYLFLAELLDEMREIH